MAIKRIVILGAGAVGGSLGVMLQRSGCEVVLVARGAHGRAIREAGLRLKTADLDCCEHPGVVAHVGQIDWQSGDLAVVAVKSQDAEQAMDELLSSAGASLPVACATNGVQSERWAAQRFATVLSMLVWMPATHLQPGEVAIHATGSIGVLDVGPYCGAGATGLAVALCEKLRAAGFDAVFRAAITPWKYAKWITNLGNTAQALVTGDWRKVAALAQAEGEAVLARAQVERVPTADLLQRTTGVRLANIDGEPRLGGSTWQSQARGKPLETPWIEGAMADLAEARGLSAPVNRLLATLARTGRQMPAQEFLQSVGADASASGVSHLAGDTNSPAR